jgi:hypothetical protein
VQVERIEAAFLGKDGIGDLGGRRMRHTVGWADNEAVEGVARIERRALEAADARAPHDQCGARRVDRDAPRLDGRRLAPGQGLAALCGDARRGRPDAAVGETRLAQRNFDALSTDELRPATLQQVVRVMRLNPVLEEFHGHGGAHDAPVEGLEIHGSKPALVNLLAEPGAQHGAHLLSL